MMHCPRLTSLAWYPVFTGVWGNHLYYNFVSWSCGNLLCIPPYSLTWRITSKKEMIYIYFFNASTFSFQKTNHPSVPWSSNREPALLETGQICVTDLTMLCVLLWTWLRLPKTILQHFNAIDNIDRSHSEGLLILIHWIHLQHIQIHFLNFQRLSLALLSRDGQ